MPLWTYFSYFPFNYLHGKKSLDISKFSYLSASVKPNLIWLTSYGGKHSPPIRQRENLPTGQICLVWKCCRRDTKLGELLSEWCIWCKQSRIEEKELVEKSPQMNIYLYRQYLQQIFKLFFATFLSFLSSLFSPHLCFCNPMFSILVFQTPLILF